MTTQEFESRIAQIKESLASAGSKIEQAFELCSALDEKLDRIGKKMHKLADGRVSTNQKLGVGE